MYLKDIVDVYESVGEVVQTVLYNVDGYQSWEDCNSPKNSDISKQHATSESCNISALVGSTVFG